MNRREEAPAVAVTMAEARTETWVPASPSIPQLELPFKAAVCDLCGTAHPAIAADVLIAADTGKMLAARADDAFPDLPGGPTSDTTSPWCRGSCAQCTLSPRACSDYTAHVKAGLLPAGKFPADYRDDRQMWAARSRATASSTTSTPSATPKAKTEVRVCSRCGRDYSWTKWYAWSWCPDCDEKKNAETETVTKTTTPLSSVRARCLDCAGGDRLYAGVRDCDITDCALYHLRSGHGSKGTGGVLSHVKTYCRLCCGDDKQAPHKVHQCPASECPLWAYRLGHRPKAVVGVGDET